VPIKKREQICWKCIYKKKKKKNVKGIRSSPFEMKWRVSLSLFSSFSLSLSLFIHGCEDREPVGK
jgi:hypothetical protein